MGGAALAAGRCDRLPVGGHRRVPGRRRRHASSSSSRSTPGCRSSTRSPRRSPASTWSASSCGSPAASRWATSRATSRGPVTPSRPASYAEDAAHGFLPATGTLAAFAARRGARGAMGLRRRGRLGGVGSTSTRCWPRSSPTRRPGPRRRCRLALALERLHVAGVTTNRDFLVRRPAAPGVPGRATRPPTSSSGSIPTAAACRSTTTGCGASRRPPRAVVAGPQPGVGAGPRARLPSGWRNSRLPAAAGRAPAGASGGCTSAYRPAARRLVPSSVTAPTPASPGAPAGARRTSTSRSTAGAACTASRAHGEPSARPGRRRWRRRSIVSPRFPVADRQSRPPVALVAPMPGVVADVRVAVGDRVARRPAAGRRSRR